MAGELWAKRASVSPAAGTSDPVTDVSLYNNLRPLSYALVRIGCQGAVTLRRIRRTRVPPNSTGTKTMGEPRMALFTTAPPRTALRPSRPCPTDTPVAGAQPSSATF